MHRTLLTTLIVCGALIGSIAGPATAQSTAQSAPAKPAIEPVNVNTATAGQFEGLPGVGARTAARIVEYRQKNGPFKKIEEILEISSSVPYSLMTLSVGDHWPVSRGRRKPQEIAG